MILPNNGKVIIIDDKPEDVKELISALSKEKVPFVHYKEEDLSDLPDSPMDNVRLLFLDLELVSDTNLSSSKNITSPIKTRLMRVIKPKTPYALVIWSKKENAYKKALLNDFEDEFKDYKPIFYTSLPKADILGKANAIEIIKKELETEMANFKSLNAFLVWEAIVNESSGRLTNDIATLFPPDTLWNQNAKFLLYKLAEAYSGKAVNDFNSEKQLKNALYTLTMTFADNIENSIDKIIDNKFSGLVDNIPATAVNEFTPMINKLLLLSESCDGPTQPGNLFLSIKEFERKLTKNEDQFISKKEGSSKAKMSAEKKKAALESMEKKHNEEKARLEVLKRNCLKKINEITVSGLNKDSYSDYSLRAEILKSVLGIELNITPLCDYAQQKAKMFRILPGILILAKYRNNLNSNPAYIYISDAEFTINKGSYIFLFDFRYLYSVQKDEIESYSSALRLKHQLLSDIQIKLGSHINRAGVVFVG